MSGKSPRSQRYAARDLSPIQTTSDDDEANQQLVFEQFTMGLGSSKPEVGAADEPLGAIEEHEEIAEEDEEAHLTLAVEQGESAQFDQEEGSQSFEGDESTNGLPKHEEEVAIKSANLLNSARRSALNASYNPVPDDSMSSSPIPSSLLQLAAPTESETTAAPQSRGKLKRPSFTAQNLNHVSKRRRKDVYDVSVSSPEKEQKAKALPKRPTQKGQAPPPAAGRKNRLSTRNNLAAPSNAATGRQSARLRGKEAEVDVSKIDFSKMPDKVNKSRSKQQASEERVVEVKGVEASPKRVTRGSSAVQPVPESRPQARKTARRKDEGSGMLQRSPSKKVTRASSNAESGLKDVANPQKPRAVKAKPAQPSPKVQRQNVEVRVPASEGVNSVENLQNDGIAHDDEDAFSSPQAAKSKARHEKLQRAKKQVASAVPPTVQQTNSAGGKSTSNSDSKVADSASAPPRRIGRPRKNGKSKDQRVFPLHSKRRLVLGEDENSKEELEKDEHVATNAVSTEELVSPHPSIEETDHSVNDESDEAQDDDGHIEIHEEPESDQEAENEPGKGAESLPETDPEDAEFRIAPEEEIQEVDEPVKPLDVLKKFASDADVSKRCRTKEGKAVVQAYRTARDLFQSDDVSEAEIQTALKSIYGELDSFTSKYASSSTIELKRDAYAKLFRSLGRLFVRLNDWTDRFLSGSDEDFQRRALRILVRFMRSILTFKKVLDNWKVKLPSDAGVRAVHTKFIVPLRILDEEYRRNLGYLEKRIEAERNRFEDEEKRIQQEEEEAHKAEQARKFNARRRKWQNLHAHRMLCENNSRRREHLRFIDLPDSEEVDANGEPFERLSVFGNRTSPPRRLQTTEAAAAWSDEANIALLNGLRDHAGPNVFEGIFAEYCGRGGVLRQYNVSEITAQATYLKHLTIKSNERYDEETQDWVRAIPELA